MNTQKKNELDEAQQVDQMIDDGLGGGRVVEQHDKKKLKSEQEKKEEKIQKEKAQNEKAHEEKAQEKRMDVDNSSMASNLKEVEQLGKEMEHMKTNKEITKGGETPDPPQNGEK